MQDYVIASEELSVVKSNHIGPNTRIWQFVVVLPNAHIGADCNLCSHVLIENDVIIGDRVTVKSGVQLWDGLRIEDDVFIGPNVTFTNDPFPRSKRYPAVFAVTTVKAGTSIGGATVLPRITIDCAPSSPSTEVPKQPTFVEQPSRCRAFSSAARWAQRAQTTFDY